MLLREKLTSQMTQATASHTGIIHKFFQNPACRSPQPAISAVMATRRATYAPKNPAATAAVGWEATAASVHANPLN